MCPNTDMRVNENVKGMCVCVWRYNPMTLTFRDERKNSSRGSWCIIMVQWRKRGIPPSQHRRMQLLRQVRVPTVGRCPTRHGTEENRKKRHLKNAGAFKACVTLSVIMREYHVKILQSQDSRMCARRNTSTSHHWSGF